MTPPPQTLAAPLIPEERVASVPAFDPDFGRSAVHDPRDGDRDAAGFTATEPRRGSADVEPSDVSHWGDQEPRPEGADSVTGVNWPVLLWIAGIHLAALAAPWCFSWSGLALCLVLYWVTGSLGVCLGYHRLLTHGSFSTPRAVRLFFAWLGGISGEGSALMWVADHRKHHAFSDQDGDPHSPRDGGLWAHMLWLFPRRSAAETAAHMRRWAPDLDRDPWMRLLHATFLVSHFAVGGALLAAGWCVGGPRLGVSWLVWGLAVRMVIVFHVTWFVNSATHMWGYRNYETTDDSRNLWWVGLLAFGEGWHNNHHAFQRMARHGHRWWEVDVTYWAILAMEAVGLAWNVVHTPHGRGGISGMTGRRSRTV